MLADIREFPGRAREMVLTRFDSSRPDPTFVDDSLVYGGWGGCLKFGFFNEEGGGG